MPRPGFCCSTVSMAVCIGAHWGRGGPLDLPRGAGMSGSVMVAKASFPSLYSVLPCGHRKKHGYSLGTPRDHPLVLARCGVHGRLEQSLATQHPPWLHWSEATEALPSPPPLLLSSSLSAAFSSVPSFTDGSVASQLASQCRNTGRALSLEPCLVVSDSLRHYGL